MSVGNDVCALQNPRVQAISPQQNLAGILDLTQDLCHYLVCRPAYLECLATLSHKKAMIK